MDNKKCIPLYGRLSQSGCSGSGGGGGIIPIGTKEINITENGTTEYDVTPYAKASVNVDVQKTGSKDIDITANGTTTENVQDVGSVNINVNVPTEKPTGSKALTYTANGTYSEDVAAVATADIEVNVPQPAGSTTINVNENGESDHDVTDYATAHVVVDVPKPTAKKTVNIVANGTTTEDVADFGSVDIVVNVSSGGDESKNILDALISGSGSIDTLTSDVSTLRRAVFNVVQNVNNYVFPNLKIMPFAVFSGSSAHVISAPKVDTIMQHAVENCKSLKKLILGECNMQSSDCVGCSELEVLFVDPPTEIYLPSLKKSLIMRNITNVPRLLGVTSSTNTPTGIYVPDDLVDAFKAATNWSEYADRIKPVSEYVES